MRTRPAFFWVEYAAGVYPPSRFTPQNYPKFTPRITPSSPLQQATSFNPGGVPLSSFPAFRCRSDERSRSRLIQSSAHFPASFFLRAARSSDEHPNRVPPEVPTNIPTAYRPKFRRTSLPAYHPKFRRTSLPACRPKFRRTSLPACRPEVRRTSLPACRPEVRRTSLPACRPEVRRTSQPACRPEVRRTSPPRPPEAITSR